MKRQASLAGGMFVLLAMLSIAACQERSEFLVALEKEANKPRSSASMDLTKVAVRYLPIGTNEKVAVNFMKNRDFHSAQGPQTYAGVYAPSYEVDYFFTYELSVSKIPFAITRTYNIILDIRGAKLVGLNASVRFYNFGIN